MNRRQIEKGLLGNEISTGLIASVAWRSRMQLLCCCFMMVIASWSLVFDLSTPFIPYSINSHFSPKKSIESRPSSCKFLSTQYSINTPNSSKLEKNQDRYISHSSAMWSPHPTSRPPLHQDLLPTFPLSPGTLIKQSSTDHISDMLSHVYSNNLDKRFRRNIVVSCTCSRPSRLFRCRSPWCYDVGGEVLMRASRLFLLWWFDSSVWVGDSFVSTADTDLWMRWVVNFCLSGFCCVGILD